MNMLFGLVFRSLLLVVWSFRLIVYGFCCIKLSDQTLSESNTFEKSCVNLFQSDFTSIGKIENRF